MQVQGGDSDRLGSVNYHPFYITSDRMGGYGRKLESERGKFVWLFVCCAPAAGWFLCLLLTKLWDEKSLKAGAAAACQDVLIFWSVLDTERIWAGVKNAYAMNYDAQPTAKGSLCYYKSREGEDKWRESETFKYDLLYNF